MATETHNPEAKYEARIDVMATEAQQIISGIEGVDKLKLSLFRANPFGGERHLQPEEWKRWIGTLSVAERTFVSGVVAYLERFVRSSKRIKDDSSVTVGNGRTWMARGRVNWKKMGKHRKAFVVKAFGSPKK